MHKLRSRLRNAVTALALLSLAACAGKGCSCVQPIKGGFPVAQRHENAIQLRATSGLFQFLDANGPKLVPQLIGGNTFTVPPTCTGNKVCCATPNMVCQLKLDVQTLQLTPTAPNILHVDTNINVSTVQDLPIDAPVIGSCNVTITSSAGPMNATTDLTFTVDKTTNTTGLSAGTTNITIPDGDVNLSGGILCSFTNAVAKGIIVSTLQSQVATQIQNLIGKQACAQCMTKDDCNSFATACTGGECMEADGKTCVPSLGLEGKMNLGSALASFAPGLQAYMDIEAVTGGYAAADTGLSLGLLGGGMGDPHNSCVPMVPAPAVATVPQSKTFYTDVLPDKATPYHLGIGVHRSELDLSLYTHLTLPTILLV
jgi:hypothetical protein